ncbi:hypothetical protein FK004_05430 [Flavobacterium kingsejongi]|uniref:Mucin 2, oligomeric mucus/gel-forming n=2 Tax=Flavobacterium kingsejongi TaxID=1678728 RepID=A0A2S1LLU0_9FLAO|nr:hypothetical protein FK004_05430 [Flavobacterium kingsejongi]
MVRFKVGNAPLNSNTLTVTWPNNSWKGVIQNATSATKVAELNADIAAAGGCGQVLEPPGGIIPANASVILVTSYEMDTPLNSFGPLSETIYIIFQNNTTTVAGHFANYLAGPNGIRTLIMNFGSCTDTVSYDRALLTTPTGVPAAADGATVLFTPAGVPTYINNGCVAPVPPFTVDAGTPVTICAGSTITLNGTAQGQQSQLWTAGTGTFSTPIALTTDYTIPANAAGSTIVLTLTATNTCGLQVSDTVTLTISTPVVPNFPSTLTFCSGTPAATLPLATTSPNGITGNWNPATINNTTNGTYTFTPDAGQCATIAVLTTTVTPQTVPDFATALTVCSGTTPPVLATTSPNGITGTWNPNSINTTTSGSYVFTPDTNGSQCASAVTLQVTVTAPVIPDFSPTLTLCSDTPAPILETTSPNGIIGTWTPAVIDNANNGTYTFTPGSGQCATTSTLTVTISPLTIPDFASTQTLCSGTVPPPLATTAPNGITGTWNPATIDTTVAATYTFTPDPGQCAATTTVTVSITPQTVPDFDTALTLCTGSIAPTLDTTSPNGIAGTWFPTAISTSTNGIYTFTPDSGQCATTVTLEVHLTPQTVPDFNTTLEVCNGTPPPALAPTSPNGISGNWSPSTIDTTLSGTYLFTPNAGQCATTASLSVTVTNGGIIPDFQTILEVCSGATPPPLASISPNGISGTWNPPTIDNVNNGTYTFTPDAGQCAVNTSQTVTVRVSGIAPNFDTTLNLCNGATAPPLATTSPNGVTGTWNPSTIDTTTSGTYIFTADPGQCATNSTLDVTITPNTVPDFDTALQFCSGATVPVLANTSPNGVAGTWNPAAISNTINGTYLFTPDAGQCATTSILQVTINPNTTPDFNTTLTICNGSPAPILATTSPNGITGTWNPSAISTSADGSYIFTPDGGQCSTTVTLTVTVTPNIIPNFDTTLSLCNGSTAPVLATTAPNGVTGIWSPTIINTTASGNYTFTPDAGQCASPTTLVVTITAPTTPDFDTTLTLCSETSAPALVATSPNGITGTWTPAVISTSTSANYDFTPLAGQCATTATLEVLISTPVLPNFDPVLSFCSGATAPNLPIISPNNITGTWNPAVIDTSTAGSYLFTPDAGQCTAPFTLTVLINAPSAPGFDTTLILCSGTPAPPLATISPNGTTGTWNPAVIDNNTSGTYTFTPDAGQCATNSTLVVTITPSTTPDFDTALSLCSAATTPTLATTSPNGIIGTWNPAVISTTANGTYTFTPDAGQCATTTTLAVTITPSTTPDFDTILSLCSGATAPTLAPTSPNGITGTWNPAVISMTGNGIYTFTPDVGQCATTATLAVTIIPSTTPDFDTALSLCSGATAPALATTSPNGITGSWNPTIISTTADGTYTFTPDAGQCATNSTLTVTITPILTPDFDTTLSLCSGATAPTLASTSPNGITGTWNPAVISATANGTYTFTPDAGQCATTTTLAVTITPSLTPDFDTTLSLCSGATAPTLAPTSFETGRNFV